MGPKLGGCVCVGGEPRRGAGGGEADSCRRDGGWVSYRIENVNIHEGKIVCVSLRVCVCVLERERERERECV